MADEFYNSTDSCYYDENSTESFNYSYLHCFYRPRPDRFVPPFVLVVTAYAIIFALSMIGNILVVITLALHKRMQTVTNILLLNLAVSDLMMGLICMPTSLTGYILRNFIFGGFFCTLQRYVEGELLLPRAMFERNK